MMLNDVAENKYSGKRHISCDWKNYKMLLKYLRTPPMVICYLRQYRIILSADTASEVRQMLSQKRR